MQFFAAILFIGIGTFVIYYLPLIAKDLQRIAKQNEEIKELLEKLINKGETK